jgi:hypothetical protein
MFGNISADNIGDFYSDLQPLMQKKMITPLVFNETVNFSENY